MTGLQQIAAAFVLGVNAAMAFGLVVIVSVVVYVVVFRPTGTTENTGAK